MHGYDETARRPWAAEYPDFWKMIKDASGEVEAVDEYGVEFWSLLPFVSIKRDHPMFSSSSSAPPESTESICENNNDALVTARSLFRMETERIREGCKCPRLAGAMNRSPIGINKKLYLEAKQVFANQPP